MKPFELFKAGKHTSSGGASLSFSADDLQAAVAAYDPALHEAPIVVGHPKDNAPAYGWIKSLSFADGSITAEPAQVDADFAEMVKAGRFKKRSASFYTPDAPNNPKPGSYYLRHVGFLGAQPPAVKGLKEVAFSDAEQGVVEFGDASRWAWSSMAAIARNFREWVIGEKGVEAADKVVPNFLIADLDSAAKAESTDPQTAAMPAFSEDDPMNIQQLQAEVTRLTVENATLKANQVPADFAERETTLAAREAEVAAALAKTARATVEARVDAAVKAGRLLPAQKKHAVDFAMALAEGEATIDFGEGDKAKKVSQREAYLLDIESRGKVVEFGELSQASGSGSDQPPIEAVQRELAAQVFSGGSAKA